MDRLEDGEAILAIGIDAGTDNGEQVATPLGTDAAGGLAKTTLGWSARWGALVKRHSRGRDSMPIDTIVRLTNSMDSIPLGEKSLLIYRELEIGVPLFLHDEMAINRYEKK